MKTRTEDFIGLVKTCGWSQAEVARRLHITPGAVSQLCNGKTHPHPATLNLLKFILAQENPKALEAYERALGGGLAPWESRLLDSLRCLPRVRREALLVAFHKMIRVVETRQR